MEGQVEKKYHILDMGVSASGRYAAISAGYEVAPGESRVVLKVVDIEKKQIAFENMEISLIHMQWHPVLEKLLYISVLSGLNSVDFAPEGGPKLTEGIIKHSVIFLESFQFSPGGEAAGYFLHNTALKKQAARQKGDVPGGIRDVLYREEDSQILFYEKGEISGKIVRMGRAWTWLDESRIIFNRQSDLLIKNIETDEMTTIASHDRFMIDMVGFGKKILLISLDFEEFEYPRQSYQLFMLEPETGEMELIGIDGDYSPRITHDGENIILERNEGEKRWIVSFSPSTKKFKNLTSPDGKSVLPCPSGKYIYCLSCDGEITSLCRVDTDTTDKEKILSLSEIFE